MPAFAPVLSPPLLLLLTVEVLFGSGDPAIETVCVMTEAIAEVAEGAEDIITKDVAVPALWIAYRSHISLRSSIKSSLI